MAAEVGIAFLSASLQVLFDRLASPGVVNFIKGKKLNPKLVERLKTTLNDVGALLNDAEIKQIKDQRVRNWLDDVKDAFYEADDLLDELSTKAAAQSQEVSYFFSLLNSQDRNMANKIADITERLEALERRKDNLGLKNVVAEKMPRGPPSTSLPDVSHVYGRDEDRKSIINLLLSYDDRKIGVIPIVGMGGVGKTTLAQSVYNDEFVRKNFDLFAWVCVSEEVDVFNIIKTVIETIIGSGKCKITDFNLLQLDLKEKLKEKKFLIVLDDVWDGSSTVWDPLMAPLNYGSEGSKLIVTTRNKRVASTIGTVQFHPLDLLSDEDCWSVFKNRASPPKNPTVDSYLAKNQRDIINKCKGLPLAAKLLGGLFGSEPDVKKWDIILQNNIWVSSESETKIVPNIVPALRVSYHYLPPHLKRCFVHCSLFPKDYEFEKDEIILFWMAEDFLQPMDGNTTLKEAGDEYFDDLISRSFFQRSSNQFSSGFVMHDLIHDLATFFAGKKFYAISKIDEENNIGKETRHMSINMLGGPFELKFSDFQTLTKAKFLRTFLPFTAPWMEKVSTEITLLQLLLNLKYMRALSLFKFEMLETLPESICELIHLRYLDLSQTKIKMLPGSLCKLHNLQTLKLRECWNLTSLPNNMHDLVNLRFLDVRNTDLQEMPRGLGKCKNLHYLSDFIISKDQGATRIEELGNLPNIGNSLRIRNLEYVSSGEEASLAKMLDKKHIERLDLSWASDDHMLDSMTERDILDKLQPHSDLRVLCIQGYRGTSWSDWLALQNVTDITLINCKNCYSLPPLGQLPFLKKLGVEGFDKMVSIETEFYYNSNKSDFTTPFPSLESLSFSRMPTWQEWCLFEMGAFPQLQELQLFDCPKLVGYLPRHLPALKHLGIFNCQQLASFPIDGFPNLEILYISRCENLESIVVSQSALLQSIIIMKNLTELSVLKCPKLKSLPRHLDRLLPNLKDLDIRGCPEIEWPGEGDMLPHLTHLAIDYSVFNKFSKEEWVQRNLPGLTIDGDYDNSSVQCFPEQGSLLPFSLNSLWLGSFKTLKTLDCEGFLHLTSLRELSIYGCPEMEKIAGQRLPSSVKHLRIVGCPLLEDQCRKKNAEIWPKISHVPEILYHW